MQALAHRPDGWVPPVVRTVATEGRGVPELLEAISTCRFEGRAAATWQAQLREMLRDRLWDEVRSKRLQPGELEAAAQEVAARERDPYSFVDEVLARRSKA